MSQTQVFVAPVRLGTSPWHSQNRLDMGGDGPQHVWHWESSSRMSNIGPTIGRNSNLPPIPNRSDKSNFFLNKPYRSCMQSKEPACSMLAGLLIQLGTSPGKIFPSLNLNMHMCSSTCTGQK